MSLRPYLWDKVLAGLPKVLIKLNEYGVELVIEHTVKALSPTLVGEALINEGLVDNRFMNQLLGKTF